MKFFAAYWLIGCLIAGLAMAADHDRCPNDKSPSTVEYAASVAIWPAFFVALATMKKPIAERTCARAAS